MKFAAIIIIAILAIACSDINTTGPETPVYEGTWTGTVLNEVIIIEMNGPPQYGTVVYYEKDGLGWFHVSNDGARIFAINYIGTIRYEYEIKGSTMTGPFSISANQIDTTVTATFNRSK